MQTAHAKAYKGLPLSGFLARWYAKNTGKSLEDYRAAAGRVAALLCDGSRVLEVAPGPGYFAVALAQLGGYEVTGLDISETFVQMAAENARNAGVRVDFRHGNASAMPFESGSFDFIYCRAAFKNFSEPVRAIDEMHRVLKPGGTALIVDLNKNVSSSEINAAVAQMGLGPINVILTKWIFKHSLIKRAYSREDFERMAAQTPFGKCDISADSIGFEVSLRK